jgi:surface polysaccharide O-acyltransferase-like enzyme
MSWLYLIMMVLVTILTAYETIYFFREFKEKGKGSLFYVGVKFLALIFLVVLLVKFTHWLIHFPQHIST